MKRLWIVCACLAFAVPGLAQTLDEPASKQKMMTSSSTSAPCTPTT